MIELKGITWNHMRGYLPMIATAQRYSELHPGMNIRWEMRSLQEFADYPLESLVDRFDLLVIDHPAVGSAAAQGLLFPLDHNLPEEFLFDQSANSVGCSYESYSYGGHQWALAIDAAAPVSGYRSDLLERAHVEPPDTWPELLELARRNLVAVSGFAIDTLCHFYMICTGLGEEPFLQENVVASEAIGIRALEMLRELMSLVVPGCSDRNPIAVWEMLTSSDSAAYCPFAYGYSNYARSNYSKHPLAFGNLVSIPSGKQCRSTLGGAGLAISSSCEHIPEALNYCGFAASPSCQAGLYFDSGGQPGHRAAWLDEEVNRNANNFFRNTLSTLDAAWLRPRWKGYLDFQERAEPVVHECVWQGCDTGSTLEKLNLLLKQARESEVA